MMTQPLTFWALVIVLAAGAAGGGAIWYTKRVADEAVSAISRFELPRREERKQTLFGREGTIVDQSDGQWSIRAADGEDGAEVVLHVRVGDETEYLETRVANQLPRLPDGTFDHSKAIVVRKVSQSDFKPGDAVYVAARENIWRKKDFEAIKAYKIVYE